MHAVPEIANGRWLGSCLEIWTSYLSTEWMARAEASHVVIAS